MLVNNLIRSGGSRERELLRFIALALIEVANLEIVVFCFVVVGQVPEDANVFQGEVVPLIVIRIVGNLIVVNVLALSPDTSQLNKFAGLSQVLGSASAVLKISRYPATVDNNGSAINGDGVFLCERLLERKTTTFIAVKRIYNVVTVVLVALRVVSHGGNEHFLGSVELT